MSGLSLDDRRQIDDLIIGFCNAVDALNDIDAVCAAFSDDAQYDLSAFGMGAFTGIAEIRGFFSGSLPAMSHSAHLVSNISVKPDGADAARAGAYVLAWSISKAGDRMELKAKYDLKLKRTAAGWRVAYMAVGLLIPPAA
mgnify:CR=1 FL=1